jgi:hypothetical protein
MTNDQDTPEAEITTRHSDDNELVQGLPPKATLSGPQRRRIQDLVADLTDAERTGHAEAVELMTHSRLALADEIAPAGGRSRRVAAVLSGIDVFSVRAKRLQRYVRVRAHYITDLARDIQEQLISGDLDGAEVLLVQNASDILGPISWFTERRGAAASQIRKRAEIDRLYITTVLDDLFEANASLRNTAPSANFESESQ